MAIQRRSGGKGRVYTFAIQYRAFHPGWTSEVPYVTALIDLDDGVRIFSNLVEVEADPKALPTVYALSHAPKTAGKSSILAVDRKTGRTRWELPRRSTQAAYSTPCVYRGEDGKTELVFSSTSHGITAESLNLLTPGFPCPAYACSPFRRRHSRLVSGFSRFRKLCYGV